jgi:hypothetical protein
MVSAATTPRAETRGVPRRDGGARSGARLTDLDEMVVGVADVGADFVSVIDGLGEELGAALAPLSVGLSDVGYA